MAVSTLATPTSDKPPFQIIVADEHRLSAGMVTPRVPAKYNALLLTLSGGADMVHESGRISLRPGNLLWIRDQEGIGVEVHKDQAVHGIYIHFSAPAEWVQQQPRLKKSEGSPMAFHLMQHLSDADPKELATVGPYLLHAALSLVHQGGRSRQEARWRGLPPLVRKGIEKFRAKPDQSYSLKSLCTALGTTPSTLCRQFKEHLGTGPLEVLQRLRLEQAAQRLELGEEQVAEISTVLGFSNPFYFTRCFTKAYGLSPKAYRARARKGVFKHWRLVNAQLPNALGLP
jgi:AraC-like DNA-binding protein